MQPRPDLAIEDADGELILLDKASGRIHQLNSTASYVWNCMSDGLAIDDIAAKLAEEFDVEPKTALSDAHAALEQFEALALVVE